MTARPCSWCAGVPCTWHRAAPSPAAVAIAALDAASSALAAAIGQASPTGEVSAATLDAMREARATIDAERERIALRGTGGT